MNKDFEIAVTLNTDEANEKIDALTAKAQALADLFPIIAEQADRAAKIMPPSTVVDAVYAMRHGCPPTTNFMRSISEMLRISLPGFEKMEWCILPGSDNAAGDGSWIVLHFKNGFRQSASTFLNAAASKFFCRLSKAQMPCGTAKIIRILKCVINNNSMRVWRYRRRTDRYQQSDASCRKGYERLNGHCAGR